MLNRKCGVTSLEMLTSLWSGNSKVKSSVLGKVKRKKFTEKKNKNKEEEIRAVRLKQQAEMNDQIRFSMVLKENKSCFKHFCLCFRPHQINFKQWKNTKIFTFQ